MTNAGFSYFNDLKVVELAAVLAGPSVGMFFAELGASVFKVEHPHGDMTRKWKLSKEDKNASVSGYYCSVNWGKEIHFLNLKEQDDYNKVCCLIEGADVLITNFKHGDAEKFNLTYEDVLKVNDKIIYAHLSGYGTGNPRPAFDVVIQAEAGYMSMNGQADSPPTKMPVAFMDVLAAHQMKEGILCGLLEREKTGKGALIEVNLYDAGIASLANQATNWLMGQEIPERRGSLHPNIAPYGEIFDCKDGRQMVLAIGTDKQFQILCDILGAPEISQKDEYINNQQRVINREVLDKELSPLFLNFKAEDLSNSFIQHHIPGGIVKNVKEVFDDAKDRNLILEETIDSVETKRVKTVVFNKVQ